MCWPGMHRWLTTKVKPVSFYESARDQDVDLPVKRHTELLQVCAKCGKPRCRTVAGKWSATDFVGLQ